MLMRLAALTFTFIGCWFLSTAAVATEKVDICAQYTDTGRSDHVSAIGMTGYDLTVATHSMNYSTLRGYIVIFWAQDQADRGSIVWPAHEVQQMRRQARGRAAKLE
jgi:hypothetical protein